MITRWHVALVAGALLACQSPLGQSSDDLQAAQARWRLAGILTYEFDIYRACGECPAEWARLLTVRVRDGAFISLTHADDGTAADTSFVADFLTMERLFAYVSRTLARRPAQFSAEYDRAVGYPILVSVDLDRRMVDDEFALGISSFRPAPPVAAVK